jgi:hypothetical protein
MAFSKEIADEVMAMPLDKVHSALRNYGYGTSADCFCTPQASRLALFHRLRIETFPTDPAGGEGQTKHHFLQVAKANR